MFPLLPLLLFELLFCIPIVVLPLIFNHSHFGWFDFVFKSNSFCFIFWFWLPLLLVLFLVRVNFIENIFFSPFIWLVLIICQFFSRSIEFVIVVSCFHDYGFVSRSILSWLLLLLFYIYITAYYFFLFFHDYYYDLFCEGCFGSLFFLRRTWHPLFFITKNIGADKGVLAESHQQFFFAPSRKNH